LITLNIPLAPSRHARQRAALVELLRTMPEVKRIDRRRYKVTLAFHGAWDDAHGNPKKRDPDSVVISLLDAIAEAAGLPGDQWLNRSVSWETYHSDNELVVVTLT
jgi:hypothetical protein